MKYLQSRYTQGIPTSGEYVLMGGQLLAPHTRAKWMSGSHLSRATLFRGSDEEKGFFSIPENTGVMRLKVIK